MLKTKLKIALEDYQLADRCFRNCQSDLAEAQKERDGLKDKIATVAAIADRIGIIYAGHQHVGQCPICDLAAWRKALADESA